MMDYVHQRQKRCFRCIDSSSLANLIFFSVFLPPLILLPSPLLESFYIEEFCGAICSQLLSAVQCLTPPCELSSFISLASFTHLAKGMLFGSVGCAKLPVSTWKSGAPLPASPSLCSPCHHVDGQLRSGSWCRRDFGAAFLWCCTHACPQSRWWDLWGGEAVASTSDMVAILLASAEDSCGNVDNIVGEGGSANLGCWSIQQCCSPQQDVIFKV